MRLMQKHGRARRGRRGQIMVILALAAVGLLGIAALGIDVFYIYWNKNRLQGGTDAAALAGATYSNNGTFPGNNGACLYATDAQNELGGGSFRAAWQAGPYNGFLVPFRFDKHPSHRADIFWQVGNTALDKRERFTMWHSAASNFLRGEKV